MQTIENLSDWETKFERFVAKQLAEADAAHDMAHINRVVVTAKALAESEKAELAVVVPAAWLHDCVVVAKDSPLRRQASRLAGDRAVEYLLDADYPDEYFEGISHAIEAHSYSAGITPVTLEAKIVQDADRLDSLGAIGIARCIMTGVSFGAELYDPRDPIAANRSLDDKKYSLDHFEVKLFKLAEMMNTSAGKAEAKKRTEFMRNYLKQFANEVAT